MSNCSCPPGTHDPDPAGSVFYVSAQDGKRSVFMAGPYPTHAEAEADVDLVRELGSVMDPRGHWYLWGTARTDAGTNVGKQILNEARDEEKMRRKAA